MGRRSIQGVSGFTQPRLSRNGQGVSGFTRRLMRWTGRGVSGFTRRLMRWTGRGVSGFTPDSSSQARRGLLPRLVLHVPERGDRGREWLMRGRLMRGTDRGLPVQPDKGLHIRRVRWELNGGHGARFAWGHW